MMASRGEFIDEELSILRRKLNDRALLLYATNPAEARIEVERCLRESLDAFAGAFGFPDSYGMDAMISATQEAAHFMESQKDIEGALRLVSQPWAFGGGLIEIKSRLESSLGAEEGPH